MVINNEKMTIYEVEDLYKKLLLELQSAKTVEIDMKNVKKIDMPAIQLLISTKKSCKENSLGFSIFNVSEEVKKALRLSGCYNILGVKHE